jgi:hypothetical protein
MLKTRRWTVSVLCLSILLTAPAALLAQEAAQQAPADPMAILKVIPQDATAFLTVRNLEKFDQDIIDVATKLGIPLGPNGVFPGLLDMMKSNLKITAGLQEKASLATVVLNCRNVETFQNIPTVILVPSDDPEALTQTMNPEKVEGLMKLNMGGTPFFAAPKGDFLVLSAGAGAVKSVVEADDEGIIQALSERQLDAFKKQAITGWVDMESFSPQLRTEVENTLTGMMMMSDPTADASQINATVDQVLQTIKQTEKMSVGIVLNEQVGLKLIFTTIMQPNTEYGKQMASIAPAKSPLLIGLPAEQAIVAAGSTMSGDKEIARKQMNKAWDQVFASPEIKQTIGEERIELLKKQLTAMFVPVDKFSFSISSLPINSEHGLIGIAAAFKTDDSRKYKANLSDLFSTVKKSFVEAMKENAQMTEEQIAAFSEAAQWRADAEQIDGLSVDHMYIDLAKAPDMDEATLQETKKILGRDGILLRVAAIDENWFVATFGGGQERFMNVVQLAREGKAPLADTMKIQKIDDRLPSEDLLAEFYFYPDNLIGLISNIAQSMGEQLPFPIALANAAPIAMTSTKVGETGQQVDVLIPIELAVSVGNTARPFIGMMMMGGMGGGQPGMQPGMQPAMPTQPSQQP